LVENKEQSKKGIESERLYEEVKKRAEKNG